MTTLNFIPENNGGGGNFSPLVSVIIPVYNVEAYLSQCLQSIVDQTYKNLEIIVVNDASSDNSEQIILDFARKDKRIISLTHTENKGLSSTRNTGIEVAKGAYIMFVDSDDWVDTPYVEKLMKAALEYNLDIVFGNVLLHDIALNIAYKNPYFVMSVSREEGCIINKFLKIIPDVSEFIEKYPQKCLAFMPSVAFAKLYKREYISKDSFPEGLIYEDEAFFSSFLFKIKNVGYYDDDISLCHYRINRENSIITKAKFSTKEVKFLDIIKVGDIIIENFKKNKPHLLAYAIGSVLSMLVDKIWNRKLNIPKEIYILECLGKKVQELLYALTPEQIATISYNRAHIIPTFLFIAQNKQLAPLEVSLLIVSDILHYFAEESVENERKHLSKRMIHKFLYARKWDRFPKLVQKIIYFLKIIKWGLRNIKELPFKS